MVILILGDIMRALEDKYIDLLINKCVNFTNTKSILLNYHAENKKFIDKLVKKLHKEGIKDIYLDEEDPYIYHDLVQKGKEEILNNPYFDKSIWNEYAKKNACFLMLKSEYPNLMDDLDISLVALATKKMMDTRKDYFEKQKHNQIPWSIAMLPSKTWAEKLFPGQRNAYAKLFKLIGSLCLLNEDNYLKAWDILIKNSNNLVKKLNKLQIKKLHYTNSLGTDFTVGLSKDARWCGLAQDVKCLVNMPSFEVFTSPNLKTAEGKIYASMPLYYNNQKVDKFYLEFKGGKLINYQAEEGKDVLKSIVDGEEAMHYLGEISLVDKTSPIAQLGKVLGTTLLDENASCHIALGEGFPECLDGGNALDDDELKKKGLNIATNHVDMMVGTNDLNIEAETYSGKKIKIFTDGKFDL